MKKASLFLSLLLVILFPVLGCSNGTSDPVQPMDSHTEEFISSLPEDSTNIMLGVYDLTFDPDSQNLDIVPSRELSAQLNLSGYLLPPSCADCVTYKIIDYLPVSKVLDVEVTVKNPTSLVAYDVRGIVYTTNANLWPTRNELAWTDMFDIPGGNAFGLNPFYQFNVAGQGNRRFPGFSSGTAVYELHFPTTWSVQLAFSGSYPAVSYAIRKIDPPVWKNEFYAGDYSYTYFTTKIYPGTFPANITGVTAYLPATEGFAYTYRIEQEQGYEIWETETFNELDAPAGTYKSLIKVTAGGENTYKYFDYEVHRGGTILNMYLDDKYRNDFGDSYKAMTNDGEHIYAVHTSSSGGKTELELHKISMDGLVLERIANTGYPPFEGFFNGRVIADDDFVYVCTGEESLSFLIFQKKDPFGMIASLGDGVNFFSKMVKDGDKIWLYGFDTSNSNRTICSIDVKNPLNPIMTRHYQVSNTVLAFIDITKHGDMLFFPTYMANMSGRGIAGYDTVQGGGLITCYSDIGSNRWYLGVETSGDYAFVTQRNTRPDPEMHLFNISNPRQWQKVKSFGPDIYGVWVDELLEMKIDDGYLYLYVRDYGFYNTVEKATLCVYDLRPGSEFPQLKFQKEFITDYPNGGLGSFDISGESMFVILADLEDPEYNGIEKYTIHWD